MTHSLDTRRSRMSLQTKALAGLVAIMLAAAIVALVFVTNGSGNDHQVAGAVTPSDVGRASIAPQTSTPAPTSTTPTSAAPSSATPSSATSASAPATTSAAHASKSASAKLVYYTVKKGDTLSTISQWFSDHGYLKLYDWNKSVIGENPDLIFPGQRIIVVAGNVGVAR